MEETVTRSKYLTQHSGVRSKAGTGWRQTSPATREPMSATRENQIKAMGPPPAVQENGLGESRGGPQSPALGSKKTTTLLVEEGLHMLNGSGGE